MPCIAGRFNPRVGPILEVAVVDTDFDPTAETSPTLHTYGALIDTGASSTCVSQKVVAEVGLVPTGKVPLAGVAGVSLVDQFTFGVGFILPTEQEPSGNVRGDLHVSQVLGCQFDKGEAVFDVLLGRDVICGGAFHMSFDGRFILSF